jgi:hypothetical protein
VNVHACFGIGVFTKRLWHDGQGRWKIDFLEIVIVPDEDETTLGMQVIVASSQNFRLDWLTAFGCYMGSGRGLARCSEGPA